jgi:Ca2+-binding EF-hand superfamily protein
LNKIAFDFYDNDRDGVLSVLDLIKMESFFEENSEISIEIDKLLEVYKNKNLRPKYVRH